MTALSERRAMATLRRDCSRRQAARACGILRDSADPYHRGIARHTIYAQGMTDTEIDAASSRANIPALSQHLHGDGDKCSAKECSGRPVIRLNRWPLCRYCYDKMELSA